jgi:hypothetical protein
VQDKKDDDGEKMELEVEYVSANLLSNVDENSALKQFEEIFAKFAKPEELVKVSLCLWCYYKCFCICLIALALLFMLDANCA